MTACDKIKPGEEGDNENPLCSLYINPTRYCNLACRHCWVSPPRRESLDGSGDEMSMDEIKAIVEEGRKLGVRYVKLTGGEPLLRRDIGVLLEFCASSKIEVDIETNGTLINEETAGMFRETGVRNVSVSLDSPYEEKNDAFRGQKGAYRAAVQGIMRLVDEGLAPQVIVSLHRDNMNDMYYFADLMERLGVRNIKINNIIPLGRGASLRETGSIPTVKEVLAFAGKADEIGNSLGISLYLDLPMAFISLDRLKAGRCGVCNIKSILGILSDGSVSICGIGYLDEGLIFGNVRKEPALLGRIWRENSVLASIRKDLPEKLEGVCGMCVFRNRCVGSCRADVYHNTGSLTAPYWFCQEAYDGGFFPRTRLVPDEIKAR